ncbi:hypothetical protein BIT28_23200 [Photobacterium proteolyticum]|uniref:Uncharacterized protein n=1 Tax=Photobacterium proteolyticum TaxID=1903952 RepID=A0A1Q9GM21_9GAMM|nr:hypothetical protein BIT28_23200 [Photobacterium proteolyticum]
MIKHYAKFTQKHSKVHLVILTILSLTIAISSYQLLEQENLWFSLGMLIPIPFFVFFAKASEYKKKYLQN